MEALQGAAKQARTTQVNKGKAWGLDDELQAALVTIMVYLQLVLQGCTFVGELLAFEHGYVLQVRVPVGIAYPAGG